MAHNNFPGYDNQFNIEEVLCEAQHRWLRTLEICEILQNYKRFTITPDPPHMPPSGSIFLFDKKVLRYFRKDGHSWRKKKDGKTIKEAHERLKAGSVDVLHCYYAHGEDNENFQRRSYWMLDQELSHIVLVHYREVKGYKTNFNRSKETEEAIGNAPDVGQELCNPEVEFSMYSGLQQSSSSILSQNTDSKCLSSSQASDYENSESGSYQAKSTTASSLGIDYDKSQKDQKELQVWGWEDALKSHSATKQLANEFIKHIPTDPFYESLTFMDLIQGQEEWKTPHRMDYLENQPSVAACKEDKSDVESNLPEKKPSQISAARIQSDKPVKDEILKKSDSFSQWMCRELGDVEPVMPSSDAYWDSDENGSDCPILSPQTEFNSYTLDPSLSQDQLFRIIDFAPNWGYAGCNTKVLISGKFLKTQHDVRKFQWSCMFGEVEVPAEVIADGVIRCHAPPLSVARVPFYVTCSSRLSCSEVREFEYRDKFVHDFDGTPLSDRCDSLLIRFGKLLSLGSSHRWNSVPYSWDGSSDFHHKISTLCKGNDTEWFQILELSSKELSQGQVRDRLTEKLLQEKLCEWLLCTAEVESGHGPRVLDENGQGILHFAAALGYDWAISPTIAAGVSINFRDVRGWTALHWAAYYGREHTVVYLISLGAFAGALTDPTPENPMGKTPAELASANGHKGLAGFLAESALSDLLECLSLKNQSKQDNVEDPPGVTSVLPALQRIATPINAGDNIDGLSLKDSLAAVCNATQAAARIHQVYRLHSFKINQMKEFCNAHMETSDEYAMSVISSKSYKCVRHAEPLHSAAAIIQNKFRSWKGRREFLTLKQKIVKIQAHVRGHQVRKHYKKFVWSVGIVEKVILRWRRKRSGLRGFKSESLTMKPESLGTSSKEDDYDFLKQGRKQAEERLQKELSRVKSMVRYPEARDQYRRLLTTVREIKEMKDGCGDVVDVTSAAASMDGDFDKLVNEDTLL